MRYVELGVTGGYGDAIQESRIVRYVVPYWGADVALVTREPLRRLFSRFGVPVATPAEVPLGAEVISHLTGLLPVGVRLPHVDTMALPTLYADSVERLSCLQHPRVGLCWYGSGGGRSAPGLDDDPRTVPGSLIDSLCEVPVTWVALQFADRARHIDPNLTTLAVHDFADLARVLCELDLVITIDTAVAHLAGTLARPTYLLLVHPKHPMSDGRWAGRPALYSSVELWRQHRPGDWSNLVTRAEQAVLTIVASDNGGPYFRFR